MTEEKSMDELKTELQLIKKQNLEREIASEKAKYEEAEALKKKEAEEKLREKLREEERNKLMEEFGDKSIIQKEKPESLEKKNTLETFRQNMVTKYNLTGKTYEDRIRDLVNQGAKWGNNKTRSG